jgi:hypothetical protein
VWLSPDAIVQALNEPLVKRCPQHGERDQVGIYCNAPMETRLSCGERLGLIDPHADLRAFIEKEIQNLEIHDKLNDGAK